jgi:AP-1 complex subunit beta-1
VRPQSGYCSHRDQGSLQRSGVAKLYDLKPELALENGFVDTLKEMVGDANPMVVANAVTALMDIHLTSQNLLESGMW